MLGRTLFGICLDSGCIYDLFELNQPGLQILEGDVVIVYQMFVASITAPFSIISHEQYRLSYLPSRPRCRYTTPAHGPFNDRVDLCTLRLRNTRNNYEICDCSRLRRRLRQVTLGSVVHIGPIVAR
jgi:hypothetical protein